MQREFEWNKGISREIEKEYIECIYSLHFSFETCSEIMPITHDPNGLPHTATLITPGHQLSDCIVI